MKFNIDIDATPAEARSFLGLPDLTPLHTLWLERLQKFSSEEGAAEEWARLVKNWSGSFLPEGLANWQSLLKTAMQPKKDQ